jgi:hypothetical protein
VGGAVVVDVVVVDVVAGVVVAGVGLIAGCPCCGLAADVVWEGVEEPAVLFDV